jgi:hypothetical protein
MWITHSLLPVALGLLNEHLQTNSSMCKYHDPRMGLAIYVPWIFEQGIT